MGNYVVKIIGGGYIPNAIRISFLKFLGMDIGDNVTLRRAEYLGSSKLIIGDNVYIGPKLYYDGKAEVVIGNNCDIAPQVMFCTNNHEIGRLCRRAGKDYYSPIKIGDGCWIGTRTTILPGVKIGSGVIIAAGSLVNKDCEANCMYAGVPARKIKELMK